LWWLGIFITQTQLMTRIYTCAQRLYFRWIRFRTPRAADIRVYVIDRPLGYCFQERPGLLIQYIGKGRFRTIGSVNGRPTGLNRLFQPKLNTVEMFNFTQR
jgi:hypothetical protein